MSLPIPSTGHSTGLSAEQQNKFDAPLMALAQQCNGDLRMLFFSFFSFLHRKTDFYCVHNEQDVKNGVHVDMGFKEGDAEKLLLAAFRQFPLRRMPPNKQLQEMKHSKMEQAHSMAPQKTVSAIVKTRNEADKDSNVRTEIDESSSTGKVVTSEDSGEKISYTEERKQIPVGNGGLGKIYPYRWTQTLQEVTIALKLPENTKSKDLKVVMKQGSISVVHSIDNKVLLEGEFRDFIRTDESTWTIESNVMLISIEKMAKNWWNKVLVEESEVIDTDLLDTTHRISDYDQANQGMIRKILFDQRQERLGLPKSEDILRKEGNSKKEMEALDLNNLPAGVEFFDKHNFPPATGGTNK